MLTTKAIAIFMAVKATKGLSPRTLTEYQYKLAMFANTHPKLPQKVKPIESFLVQTGPSLDTRDTYYRLLRNFYNVLMRRMIVSSNPIRLIEAPKVPRKVARSLTPAQLGQLLHCLHLRPQVRAFLFLLADTGVRLSEALSVTPCSANGVVITVTGKTGEREVPISPQVRQMVLDALPWPWATYYTASRAVRRAFGDAGITGPRASAQSLRHTFCRSWDGDETLLQGIMGWTSLKMLQVYRPYSLQRAIAQHRDNSPVNRINGHSLPLFSPQV